MPYRSYFKILGLSPGATKKEIKKAFRRKAMLTHPDKNPNKNAQIEFYRLNEAYEILIGEKSLPRTQSRTNSRTQSSQQSNKAEDLRQEREKRREKVREAKRKKEEAYRNSPQFKLDLAIGVLLDQLGYFVGLLAMIPIPIFLFVGGAGIFVSLFLTALTSPFWFRALVDRKSTIHPKHFWIAFKYVYLKTNFKYYLYGLINAILFFTVVLSSFINLFYFYLILSLPIVGLIILKKRKKIEISTGIMDIVGGILPTFCHVLLLFNLMFCGPSRYEYHKIQNPNRRDDFVVELANNAYQDYYGIRLFMETRRKHKTYVLFEVSDGLFGIKVLNDYRFISRP